MSSDSSSSSNPGQGQGQGDGGNLGPLNTYASPTSPTTMMANTPTSIISTGTSATSHQTIITVELPNASVFKFSVSSYVTPKELLTLVCRKVRIGLSDYFGFAIQKNFENGSPTLSSSSGIPEEFRPYQERVFLADNIPIIEQGVYKPGLKLWFTIKYAFVNLKKESIDDSTAELLYYDLKNRFMKTTTKRDLTRDVSDQLSAFIVRITEAAEGREIKLTTENIGQFMPKVMLSGGQDKQSNNSDNDILRNVLNLMRAIKSLSAKECTRKFLGYVRANCPYFFHCYWEAVYSEFNIPMILGIAPEGVTFYNSDVKPKYFVPIKACLHWDYTSIEDPGESKFSEADNNSGTPRNDSADDSVGQLGNSLSLASKNFTSNENLYNKSGVSAAVGTWKNFLNNKRRVPITIRGSTVEKGATVSGGSNGSGGLNVSAGALGVNAGAAGTLNYNGNGNGNGSFTNNDSITSVTGEKCCKAHFILKTDNTNLKEIECIILSQISNTGVVNELLCFYANKLALNTEQVVQTTVDIIDDPANPVEGHEGPITCIANYDYIAKTEEELMFMKDEVITVIEKLGNGFYMGECKGLRGVFRGNYMTFKKNTPQVAANGKPAANVILRRRSTNEAQFSAGDGNEIVVIHFLDQSRITILVSAKTTGKGLREMIIDKMELNEHEFFDVADETQYPDRWLHPNIPVILQGISQASRLVFKARFLYKNVEEIHDQKAMHLYFAQVKHLVLSGIIPLTENDAIELAGVQLQATLGDHDSEKHKPGYLDSLSLILPPQYATKISLTRNEAWWQKKAFAAHQSQRGLPVVEAERLYIQLAQKQPLFGYNIYPISNPESVLLGVNRQGVVIIDKISREIKERLNFQETLTEWQNKSFTLILKNGISGNSFTEKTIRCFSFKTLDILEEIFLLNEHNTKINLRKSCKEVRNMFQLLGIPLELPVSLKGSKVMSNDPENLFSCLRDGTALCKLVNCIKSNEKLQEVNFQSSEFHDLATYLCMENINIFLTFAREELRFPDKDLFIPEDLYNFEVASCSGILLFLNSFFAHERVNVHVKRAQELEQQEKSKSKLSNTKHMRELVVNEIITTERNYVKDLDSTINTFYIPLTNSKAISEKALRNLFLNWLDLYEFQKSFLENLEVAIAGTNDKVNIATSIIQNIEGFEDHYQIYCAGHTEAVESLQEIKDNPEVAAAIGEQNFPAPWSVVLTSQLIKPVQRILKYHLLLRELIKNTQQDSPEWESLQQALEKMQKVTQNINEIKRFKENQQSLKDLQNRIEGYEGKPIMQYGDLVIDGNLTMFDKSLNFKKGTGKNDVHFHLFLFKEIILCCKEYKKKQKDLAYKFKQIIPINMILVKDQVTNFGDSEDMKCAWELVRMDSQKTYVMINRTYEEKERWVSELVQYIQKNNQIAPQEYGVNSFEKTIIEAERKNRMKQSNDAMEASHIRDVGLSSVDSTNGNTGNNRISNIPGETSASLTDDEGNSEIANLQDQSFLESQQVQIMSRTQSMSVDMLRQKFEQDKNQREQSLIKLEEVNRNLLNLLNTNTYLTQEEIPKLEEVLLTERSISRKLELDAIREKAVTRALEEKVSLEDARRDELVKVLQGNLQQLREFRGKLTSLMSKDKKQRDNMVSQVNELGELYGMGVVLTPSLASILSSNTLKMARKQVLKSEEEL